MPETPDAATRLDDLRSEAEAAIAQAPDAATLEELRVRYLGRKSELTTVLRGIRDLPPEQRGPIGKAANEARVTLEEVLDLRREALEGHELERRLAEDRIDVTLPGDPPRPRGHLHVINATRRDIEDVFLGLGFSVAEGPEVEYDYYNFEALNMPPAHPARAMQDTFYLSDQVVLRTHTSPMQVRSMELQPPPIYMIFPGRVYRRDSDATHTPMFHQVEGLAIDEDITLGDLVGVLRELARALFGDEREVKVRSSYFPFTEPSVEVDVSCFRCGGRGHMPDGSRDGLCKGSGWIEILGAGMVDPNVMGFVSGTGYDPERVQGFAFGMGIERIAFLRHGVPDLRMFFENDLRMLEQFG
jgi:phenylalanyl-tRNA synthetase alpha chain